MKVKIVTVDTGEEKLLLELDATPSERFSFAQEATEHPIETGADVTDHIRRRPDSLSLEGVVSNKPIVRIDKGDKAAIEAAAGRSASALQALESLEGRTCNVITELRKYVNMVCLTIDVNRTSETADVLAFSATFREVFRVTTATVRLETTAVHGNPPANYGQMPGKKAPEAVEDESWMSSGIEAGKNFFASPKQ